MAAYRESWNSKWMGGSATNTTHSSAGFENRDRTAVAVEAALEPLPTWDGLACSANYGDNYGRDPIAAESRRRQHDKAQDNLRERALHGLDQVDFKLEGGKGGPYTSDYAARRSSNLTGNPNVVERGSPRSTRRTESPEPNQEHLSEDGGTLTHVIRLHRTGSVEVERMRGPSTPEDTAGDPGEIGARRRARELSETREAGRADVRPRGELRGCYGYYAEEERFWQARCPTSTAGGRETNYSAQTMAATVTSRPTGTPTVIAPSQTRAGHARPIDDHANNRSGRRRAEASRRKPLGDSGDRHNDPRRPPAAGDDCGTGTSDVARKRQTTMPSGVLGCEGSGTGLLLPGGRGSGPCRMADAADVSQERGELLESKDSGFSAKATVVEGVRAGTGETALPPSGVVPLGWDAASMNGGGIANSSRLDGRYRAPEIPPPPPPPLPPPPPSPSKRSSIAREGATPENQLLPEGRFDARRLGPGGREHAGKRRVCALEGVESTLQVVLESMKGGLRSDATSLSVNDTFHANADSSSSENSKRCFCYDSTTTDAPTPPFPSSNTRNPRLGQRTRDKGPQQPASLRSHVRDAACVRKAQDSEGELPSSGKRGAGGAASGDNVDTNAGAGGFDCVGRHQSARRDGDGLFETLRAGGNRQQVGREKEEGHGEEEGGEEEMMAGRVIELSRGIALRCVHLEQECLRRGRTQSRLFQEQLRGVRQAAQDMTRRAIRAERLGAKRRLDDAKKSFEETEAALLAKGERAEESWKVERESLVANAAAAKSELDKVRRLSQEEAEDRRRDAEAALETQKLELQRGWTEEKGRVRRAAEDALRRVEEGRARAEVEAAQEMRTARDSLEAQIRSWKSKAEAAERRAAEERDKRRALEAGGKGPLAKEAEKARQVQETVLRDLRTKSEQDRGAHLREIERLEEEHRAHILRVHLEKKRATETGRRRWQQEAQELQAEAAAKAEEAATHAATERAEALKRLRLAHDAEMRKAGRDVLRLERQLRIRQREHPDAGVVSRLKGDDLDSSILPRRSCSPEGLAPKVTMESEGADSRLVGLDGGEGPSRLSPGPSNVVGRAHPREHSRRSREEEVRRDELVPGDVFRGDSVDTSAGNFEKYVSLGSESSL